MIPRLAITPGEPAGIGLDILIQAVQQGSPYALIAYANPELLIARAAQLNLPLTLLPASHPFSETANQSLEPSQLYIYPVSNSAPVAPGSPSVDNASYVLEAISQAIADCQNGQVDGLVTGPVHKGIINESGIPFTGHTEFLAEKTNTKQVVMMLASRTLRVALATTHLPLSAVAAQITQQRLETVLRILHQDLCGHFGIDNPRIVVAGLNPHAGEGGHLGKEEIDVIEPVIDRLKRQGFQLQGPLPADTLFTPKVLKDCDAVLAMYHDQGLPVLKYSSFGEAANITLGLPIIRTSVDHGTALDLAGSGQSNPGSLLTAIQQAAAMATARNAHKQGHQ